MQIANQKNNCLNLNLMLLPLLLHKPNYYYQLLDNLNYYVQR